MKQTYAQQLEEIMFNFLLCQRVVNPPPFRIPHILHNQTVRTRCRIMNDIEQCDDVRSTGQISKNLYFAFDLPLRNRLEHFNDHSLFIGCIDPFENLDGT